MNNIPRSQNIVLGTIFGILAFLSLSLMSVFVKEIGNALPTTILIFARFLLSLIVVMPFILLDKSFTFKIEKPISYLIRIFSALLALGILFYVIKFIPLVDALLLNCTAPLFVPLIAFCLTGAKTPKKAWGGIILGFLGVAIILHPSKEIFNWVSLLALASGFLAGLSYVQIRMISKTSSTNQMFFYYFAVSTLATGLISIPQWQMPSTPMLWLLLLGVAFFGTLYQVLVTLASIKAPVRLTSPLMFFSVVFGGIFDWLLWHHIPSMITIIGAICVIVGAIITVYFGHKEIATKPH